MLANYLSSKNKKPEKIALISALYRDCMAFYMYAVGPAISSEPIFFLALLRFDYIFARSVGEIFPFI